MRPVRKADNLTIFCAVVMKSGNFNLMEASEPHGTALLLGYMRATVAWDPGNPLYYSKTKK